MYYCNYIFRIFVHLFILHMLYELEVGKYEILQIDVHQTGISAINVFQTQLEFFKAFETNVQTKLKMVSKAEMASLNSR